MCGEGFIGGKGMAGGVDYGGFYGRGWGFGVRRRRGLRSGVRRTGWWVVAGKGWGGAGGEESWVCLGCGGLVGFLICVGGGLCVFLFHGVWGFVFGVCSLGKSRRHLENFYILRPRRIKGAVKNIG